MPLTTATRTSSKMIGVGWRHCQPRMRTSYESSFTLESSLINRLPNKPTLQNCGRATSSSTSKAHFQNMWCMGIRPRFVGIPRIRDRLTFARTGAISTLALVMVEPSRRPSSTTPKPSRFTRSASHDRSRLSTGSSPPIHRLGRRFGRCPARRRNDPVGALLSQESALYRTSSR